MSVIRMSGLLVVAGLVLHASPSSWAADVIYTTGEPLGVVIIADGTSSNGGYISGFLDATNPKRHTATAFTLKAAVTIEEAVVYWFDNEDNPTLPPTTNYGWIIYGDNPAGGPDVSNIVATDSFPGTDITNETWVEPIGFGETDWKRRFPMSVELEPGTYWVTFHGKEGAIGWLTGALDGWPELWRSTIGTDYSLWINTIWETPDDPEDVYHPAFELLGTVITPPVECEGDANGDGTVDPLDSGFALSRFGCAVGAGDPDCDASDQNGDGMVDPLDVGFILSRFGDCPVAVAGPAPQPHRPTMMPASDRESVSSPVVD